MKKKNMWLWVQDKKIVEKFKELKISEAIFFSLFVFFYSTQYSWQFFSKYFFRIPDSFEKLVSYVLPYWWFAVLAILFVSRLSLLSSVFNFSNISFRNFLVIDRRIYALFCFSLIVALGMVLIFSDSWAGIKRSIDAMVANADFLKYFYNIVEEELLYRFLLYYSLNRLLGRQVAFYSTVTMFSMRHHLNSFYYPFAVAPAGILFSVTALATGRIWIPILLHCIFNASIYIFIVYVL